MLSAPRLSDQHVRAFDQVWIIPGTPASGWLDALRFDDIHLGGIFPGLIGDEFVDDMLAMWLRVPDSGERCERTARKLLARESGLHWVWAWNLMRLCQQGWLWINGMLLRQGVNSEYLSLSDWLYAAYTMIYESKDADGRVALESDLMIPPRGVGLLLPAAVQHQGAMAFALD